MSECITEEIVANVGGLTVHEIGQALIVYIGAYDVMAFWAAVDEPIVVARLFKDEEWPIALWKLP